MKTLILTGKLVTYSEYVYPLYRMQEEGYECDIAVRDKATVFGELKGQAGLVEAGPIVPTRDIPKVEEAGNYQLLILPGGAKAMEYLRQDKGVIDFIAAFHKNGGVIASICHAAQLLISAKLVRGRHISGYYSIKDDIENAGGTFVDAPSVISDRIVSSPHYKHTGVWMFSVLSTLRDNLKRAA